MLVCGWLKKFLWIALLVLCGVCFSLCSAAETLASDSTPPVTTHSLSGVLGNNDWYTSTVDVTLRASDIDSGPKSTTYWLNASDPVTKTHTSGQNQIVNPSFENGWFFSINNWAHNSGAGFWQSWVFHKFGWRSAAIGNLLSGDKFFYWHNRGSFVPTAEGEHYSVSAWVKTFDIGGLGAWFEIWGRAAVGADDQLIAASGKVNGTVDWTLLEQSFTMPAGFEGVYVKLGMKDEGLAGLAYWDGVSLYGGYSALTSFTVVENGSHTLHYYSEDNAGNIESEKTAPLKIDTVPPHDWNNFTYLPGSNDHSYIASIEVIDETSGIDVSTATYRWYTDHQDWGWSCESEEEWDPVASVTRVSDGLAASDGETTEVELTTPEIDFGNSATVMRVQFRVGDMAGSSADSPVLTIEGAWLQLDGGFLYSQGEISMTAAAPAGKHNSNSLVLSGGQIIGFDTSTSWLDTSYAHNFSSAAGVSDILEAYDDLRSRASSLPDNKLPTSSGVYVFDGDYVIDHNSTPSGFEGNELAAVIFIDGDLLVKNGYSMDPSSAVLFVVEDDVGIAGAVEEIDGVFLCNGEFDTNYDNKLQKQLNLKGGIVALGGVILGRDLGRKGSPSNGESPAELVNLPESYFFNEEFVRLVESKTSAHYEWREVGP